MKRLFDNHPLGVVFTLVTLCLLPVLIGRDFTPSNELRYLSIADEAIANGNIFAFYNHGIPYADKPPLYLWIVTCCKLLLGRHCMFLLSLFSLIPAYITIAVMDKWLRLEHEVKALTRAATALTALTTVMFIGSAVVLRMDMLMTMFIVLALFSFFKIYKGTGNVSREKWLLPVWIFMALFSKGPVGFFMPILAITAFLIVKKEFRRFGEFLGWKAWLLMFGLFGLWILGVWLDGGREYIENLLIHQTVGRAVNSFSHDKPFWYYLVHIWWVAAPWCLVAIPLIIIRWKARKTDTEILFLTAVAVTFVMLSCFSAKLGIYLLPILPFLVYFIPVIQARTSRPAWMDKAVIIGSGILFLLVFAGGLFIGRINPYVGYGPVCDRIPSDIPVSTLYVSRPENMDVYLGRDVTDYGKDPDSLLAVPRPSPSALVVKTDKIEEGTALSGLISSGKQSEHIGPYTLVIF